MMICLHRLAGSETGRIRGLRAAGSEAMLGGGSAACQCAGTAAIRSRGAPLTALTALQITIGNARHKHG
jgi:hypothetical protein